jgi:hypothetical protein
MATETTDEALNGYAAAVTEAWIGNGRMLQDLASEVGVVPQFISQVRLGQSRLGLKSARGFAVTLGVDLGELERRALAWHAAGRPPLGPEALTGAQGGAK